MILPKTLYRCFANNPIAQSEIAQLRRHASLNHSWMRWSFYFLLALASIMASVPLWLYLTDDFPTYLVIPVMVGVIYLVHLAVGVRTLFLATQIVGREHQPGMLDKLFLTELDSRQIVVGKWLAVLCYVWPNHVIAALLKGGLVYGLAQFFDVVSLAGCSSHFSNTLCYYSYPIPYQTIGPGDPSIKLLVVGTILLIAFGLLEAALLTALGIVCSLFVRERRSVGFIVAGTIRVMLSVLVICSWSLISSKRWRIGESVISRFNYVVTSRFINSVEFAAYDLSDTLQLTLSSLGDNGTVLIVDMMRPYAPPIHVVRRMFAAVCGLGIYLVLISLSWRLAEHMIIKQGALRPSDP